MLDLLLIHIIPAAHSLLPVSWFSDRATAMLVAIALQESKVRSRIQVGGGPARGFWQFERGERGTGNGVAGVLEHSATREPMREVLRVLRYPVDASPGDVHRAIEHNDVLAACLARCLLRIDPRPLPTSIQPGMGWDIYMSSWRPGKPHPETWAAYFSEAWDKTRIPIPGMRA